VKWRGPGSPIKVGSKLRGKTVFYITNVIGSEFSQGLLRGIRQAVGLVGLKLVVTDARGDPATAGRLIQQAIGRHANVIVVSGVASNQITAPLKAAKKAGIPVVEVEEGDPRIPPASERALGVFGQVSASFSSAGKTLAALAVANSGDSANVIVLDVPGIGINVPYMAAFRSTMRKLCPSCKYEVVHVLVSNFVTQLRGQTTNAIQSNPSANYVMPLFDLFIPYVLPAVAQLNAQNRVKVASWDAVLESMKAVQSGQMIADGGSPLGWYGWAIIDQSVRALLHTAPVADEHIPIRLFTTKTAKKLKMTHSANASWYGKANYVAGYKKLWGFH
jgi:ribose transport system substrate-binding protein